MAMGEWPKNISGKCMSSVALGGERRCAWVLQSRAWCLLPMVQRASLAMFDASSNEQRTAALSETGPPERCMVERREDRRVATSTSDARLESSDIENRSAWGPAKS
jgi:hypothetical protein